MSFGDFISVHSGYSGGGDASVVADIARSTFVASQSSSTMSSSSVVSVALRIDGQVNMGLARDQHFDPSALLRMGNDGSDSRSGSDNFEVGSGDDQELANEQPPRKKYHRHTPHQIQELENFFKDSPHPDEKQRTDLSRRLGLENKQVKFWFQNRRTQMKTQIERHENVILRQENDKLRAENSVMRDAMANPVCNNCGGSAVPGQVPIEQHQLRIENARLKEELNRICALANKFLGRPLSSLVGSTSIPASSFGFDLGVGQSSFGGMSSTGMPANEVSFETSMHMSLAVAAMDELVKIAQADSPMWIKSLDGGKEMLNHDEYVRVFAPFTGMKPSGLLSEASRGTGLFTINSLALVESLMDANRYGDMFPCLVAKASALGTISCGSGGTRNGALQVMQAEFQLLSPLVPVRSLRFLRFCKQHADGVWAVVDVSMDINQDVSDMNPPLSCRRLPSGCIVQDMPNGYSKVTWVEHTEYNGGLVHQLYQPAISSGIGFGAQRWLATLQRQCECMAVLSSPPVSDGIASALTLGGKVSILKLARRMVDNYCSGVSPSSVRQWDRLLVTNVREDVKVMTRRNMDDPGEPPGIVLSAATSVWMPVAYQRVFEFLRNEGVRSRWDILSNGGPTEEVFRIAKGSGNGNAISVLRTTAITATDTTMLILQETWIDTSGAVVVYAPIDTPSINLVMQGGDPAFVSLLPSGFAVIPNVQTEYLGLSSFQEPLATVEGHGGGGGGSAGCLLTLGFQILVNSIPSAKLTVESVETVSNLISCTIQKIKSALDVS